MQSIPNNELVRSCLTELCAREGFSDPGNLVQRDLTTLCDTIESKTGVLISLSTIKRLLNGQFSRLPQVATLDAIAAAAGYQNWRDFTLRKNALTEPFPRQTDVAANSPKPQPAPSKTTNRTRYILAAIILVLASAATLAIIMSSRPGPGNIDKAHFSAAKVTGNDIPNTVIFSYNVDSVKADSFFIQQSWDRNRRVRIYKNNYTLTDIYYEPGYHTAKLIADDKVIRTIPVSIPTDRWLYFAIEPVPGGKPVYKYIQPKENPDTGTIQLSPQDLVNSKVDIQKENTFCIVYSPSDIQYSSDNFTLKCRVRVKEVNNESCPRLGLEVYCQHNFMIFYSTLKGCTSELQAYFGEHMLDGKNNDLSGLGANLREWQDMEFSVKDKKVNIRINGRVALTSAYTQSSGLITGIGFISNGLCEVKFVDLTTKDGKTIYNRSPPKHT
jgi:hypothetical protein